MQRKRWFWFFAVLTVLGVIAAVVPVVYNLGLQLRPEQIAAARQRWQQHGPASYDLTLKSKADDKPEDIFAVKVRGRKVVLVTCNNYPLSSRPDVPQDFESYSVPGLLNRMEDDLNADLNSGRRRSYFAAAFDADNGCPLRYVRRDRETGQRVQWMVELTTASP